MPHTVMESRFPTDLGEIIPKDMPQLARKSRSGLLIAAGDSLRDLRHSQIHPFSATETSSTRPRPSLPLFLESLT